MPKSSSLDPVWKELIFRSERSGTELSMRFWNLLTTTEGPGPFSESSPLTSAATRMTSALWQPRDGGTTKRPSRFAAQPDRSGSISSILTSMGGSPKRVLQEPVASGRKSATFTLPGDVPAGAKNENTDGTTRSGLEEHEEPGSSPQISRPAGGRLSTTKGSDSGPASPFSFNICSVRVSGRCVPRFETSISSVRSPFSSFTVFPCRTPSTRYPAGSTSPAAPFSRKVSLAGPVRLKVTLSRALSSRPKAPAILFSSSDRSWGVRESHGSKTDGASPQAGCPGGSRGGTITTPGKDRGPV